MFGWSPVTIIIILVIVFLIFGAGKLPEIGSGLGKALKNFKNSVSGKDEIDVTPEDSNDEAAPEKPKKKQITKSSTAPSSAKRKKKQAGSKTAKNK